MLENWERGSPLPLFVEKAAKDCRAPIAQIWRLGFVSSLAPILGALTNRQRIFPSYAPRIGALLGKLGKERMEASPGIEPGYADLQSAASPLRHEAFVTQSKRISIRKTEDARYEQFARGGARV